MIWEAMKTFNPSSLDPREEVFESSKMNGPKDVSVNNLSIFLQADPQIITCPSNISLEHFTLVDIVLRQF